MGFNQTITNFGNSYLDDTIGKITLRKGSLLGSTLTPNLNSKITAGSESDTAST